MGAEPSVAERDAVIGLINAWVGPHKLQYYLTFRYLSNVPVLQVTISHNNYLTDADDAVDLFRYIGEVAPLSYGQLHLRDPDGRYGHYNTQYLAVLSRGIVTEIPDPFFTPCIPNVEGFDPDSEEEQCVSDFVDKYLPIGSVVTLHGGTKKLMIFGRHQQDTANDRVFDYVGCPYPEGNIGSRATFLFNHNDIAWVHYFGLRDGEEQAWSQLSSTANERNSITGEDMEINGWAIFWESYGWDEDINDQRDRIAVEVENQIDAMALRDWVNLGRYNGNPMLQVALQTDHYDETTDRIIEFFHYLMEAAPGSYGKLHIRDQEGRFGDPNVMHLLLMARGSITRTVDPFFTPCVPKIADPGPGQRAKLSELAPKYLPIGSVVTLNNGDKKLMIFGKRQRDTANDTEFDYVGCPYPEGNIGPKATFLFNHDDIGWIHFLGLSDDGPQSWANHPVPQSNTAAK